jgi:hypothetical protein
MHTFIQKTVLYLTLSLGILISQSHAEAAAERAPGDTPESRMLILQDIQEKAGSEWSAMLFELIKTTYSEEQAALKRSKEYEYAYLESQESLQKLKEEPESSRDLALESSLYNRSLIMKLAAQNSLAQSKQFNSMGKIISLLAIAEGRTQ